MQYMRFGNTGMQVSRLSLGAMTFGTRLGAEAAARVMDEAIDSGVNLIDTADSYRDSESIIGEVLPPEKRERVYIATKVFSRHCRDDRVGRNSRVNITSSLERSLRLLRTDYVDLYQLHHPDPETPLDETLATLDHLVRQGKIRYLGVSNHYAWQLALLLGDCKARGWEPPVSLQVGHNILDRQIEMETVPFCLRCNIAIMAYGPLCGGILTGKYHQERGAPPGSRGEKIRRMREYVEDEEVRTVVSEIHRLAEASGLGMNQLAVLWLLHKPYATTIILGGSEPEHFRQLYAIADQRLEDAVVERIDSLSARRVYLPFANQPFRDGPPLSPLR